VRRNKLIQFRNFSNNLFLIAGHRRITWPWIASVRLHERSQRTAIVNSNFHPNCAWTTESRQAVWKCTRCWIDCRLVIPTNRGPTSTGFQIPIIRTHLWSSVPTWMIFHYPRRNQLHRWLAINCTSILASLPMRTMNPITSTLKTTQGSFDILYATDSLSLLFVQVSVKLLDFKFFLRRWLLYKGFLLVYDLPSHTNRITFSTL